MNNATNRIKKRADVLAEYMIDRCNKLEEANHEMSIRSLTDGSKLKKYDDAFYDAVRKAEEVEKLDNGVIQLSFKNENGARMCKAFSPKDPLYQIAEILLEKRNRWRL